jgi:hypothetical protein
MAKKEEKTSIARMAVIAGAASALRYKEKNPRASEQEVIQHVTNNAEDILERIDVNEE